MRASMEMPCSSAADSRRAVAASISAAAYVRLLSFRHVSGGLVRLIMPASHRFLLYRSFGARASCQHFSIGEGVTTVSSDLGDDAPLRRDLITLGHRRRFQCFHDFGDSPDMMRGD